MLVTMRGVWLVLLVACYQNPALDTACKVRCTDSCPSGSTCVDGYCVGPGETCAGDAGLDATVGTACAVDVALGRHHGCMRKPNGTVWCSGHNGGGELGTGEMGSDVATAEQQVVDAVGPITDAIAIGAGHSHACAVRSGGEVWCWGQGGNGQRGDNTYQDSTRATRVVKSDTSPLTNVVEVVGGEIFTCARDSAGGAWCWGYGGLGQMGDNTGGHPYAAPVLDSSFAPFTGITAIAAGTNHACVLTTAHEAWCWGENYYGAIGDATNNNAFLPVRPLANVAAIAAGKYHTCAVTLNSTVNCWGFRWQGRLGDGANQNYNAPTAFVLTMADGTQFTGATAITVGAFSCALTSDQRVLCWGNSPHGQAGAGSLFPQPITIAGGEPLTNVDRLIGSHAHACAHRSDGVWLCWGRNTEGELANGTFMNASTATPITLACP